MRIVSQIALATAVACGVAMGTTPLARGSGDEILSGTYDLEGPNSTLDRWVITPSCSEPAVGCRADIHSSSIDGQAYYRGAATWMMTLKGQVPVCPDKSKTNGAMVYVWNAKTLAGQLTTIQRGLCQMTRPGQDQIPFSLVKVA